jgi:hypothetical protein
MRLASTRWPAGLVLVWTLSAVALAVPGCGYTSSLRVSERYPTVGLEIFGNDSFERDLERPLHDEMSRALRDLSDARLVDPGKADAVLRGKVLLYHRRSGIRSRENVLLETGVRIDVEGSLYKAGKLTPVRTHRASSAVGYTLDQPGNELEARDRGLRHIAEELVLTLLTPDT